MRLSLLCLLLLISISIVSATPHNVYPSFASNENRAVIEENTFMITDDIIYRTGYYSVNGTSWTPFTLFGNEYHNHIEWLSISASYSSPVALSGIGEHYIIVFSCSLTNNAWDCHASTNNNGFWQLLIINNSAQPETPLITCDEVTCDQGEYCLEEGGVCLLSVPGNTYFVSLDGDDNSPGTFEQPFYHWQTGVNAAQAGDIVYIRGGVWQPTERRQGFRTIGIGLMDKRGTKEEPIRIFNYPGEKPVLDARHIKPDQYQWSSGISMNNVEYIHLKGLTVSHIHQTPPDFTHEKPYSEVYGVGCSPCANMIYENMVVHDIHGRGFQHWSGAWNEPEAPFLSDNTSWINCDAYNLFSKYESNPGNAADGWKVGTDYGSTFTWKGCRAWNYSDDGFDPHGSGKRIFEDSWAMSTDTFETWREDERNEYLATGTGSWITYLDEMGIPEDDRISFTQGWNIEGNGFKMTGVRPSDMTGYALWGENQVIMKNCIAVNNAYMGIYNNILVNYDDQWPNNGLLYNNLAYNNYHGYGDTNASTYYNNIVYGSRAIGPIGEQYEIAISRANYTESNNNWKLRLGRGWPYWEYASDITVTEEDFISLDYWELTRPRKADGSLPDIEFGHLAPGSDLIDKGTLIPGYHCATNGSHPGEDCREWFGSAPDLGPFEFKG